MELRWELTGAGERPIALRRRGGGRRPAVIRPVLTVQDLCRLLRRSRRQVYRYLKTGRLQASARILGQWLFSAEEARLFEKERVPTFLRPFFWDVRVADLSVGRHRDFILARLLESGDRKAVQWALQTYPREAILSFLKGRGNAVLSKRARSFWLSFFREQAAKEFRPSWRSQGRRWGGSSA